MRIAKPWGLRCNSPQMKKSTFLFLLFFSYLTFFFPILSLLQLFFPLSIFITNSEQQFRSTIPELDQSGQHNLLASVAVLYISTGRPLHTSSTSIPHLHSRSARFHHYHHNQSRKSNSIRTGTGLGNGGSGVTQRTARKCSDRVLLISLLYS